MQTRVSKRMCCSALLLLVTGCAAAGKHQLAAVAMFDRGDAANAISEFEKAASSRGAEHQLITVDKAIASLMAGDAKTCERSLRQVRQRIDHLRQTDLREQTAAVLSDDKAIAWSGREFEQRMIDDLLILSSLVGDRQDAFAYATQAMEHTVVDREQCATVNAEKSDVVTIGHSTGGLSRSATGPTPNRFAVNALTAYLSAAVHSELPMNTDITSSAVEDVGFWINSEHGRPIRTGFGVDSTKGHGVLHVITFVDRVTAWKAETAAPTSAALLMADRILSEIGDHTLPPTVAPVRIARPERGSCSNPFMMTAQIHGRPDETEIVSSTLVDLNRAAWDSYQADRTRQVARSVARRVVKKGTIYAAKNQLSVSSDSGVDVLFNLGGMAWESLEKPDTRRLTLVPARIEVLQMELPVGAHRVNLKTTRTDSQMVTSATKSVMAEIENGKNTFVLCFRSHDTITGIVSGSGMSQSGRQSAAP